MVAQLNIDNSDILTLNLGGEKSIKVSRTVLTKVKGSTLEAMFSGRHKLTQVDGEYYIDRDADLFCMVVSFLRNGSYPEVENKTLRERFKQELRYWCLDEQYQEIAQVNETDIESLSKIFDNITDNCNQSLKERWTYHGKFDLIKHLKAGAVAMHEKHIIFQNICTTDKFLYFG